MFYQHDAFEQRIESYSQTDQKKIANKKTIKA